MRSPLQARAAIALDRGAVGLVVRRLEDERQLQRAAYAFDDLGHPHRVLLAFDDARPGDEEQFSGADPTLSTWKLMAMSRKS